MSFVLAGSLVPAKQHHPQDPFLDHPRKAIKSKALALRVGGITYTTNHTYQIGTKVIMSYLHAFRTELHTVGMFFVRLYLFRSSTSLGWEEDSIDSYIRSARTAKRTNEREQCATRRPQTPASRIVQPFGNRDIKTTPTQSLPPNDEDISCPCLSDGHYGGDHCSYG